MAEAPRRLFHIAPLAAWRAHEASGAPEWRPPSLASEGFVHLSFEDQLAGTLAAHFAHEHALALVELDPSRLGTALRLERSRDGALFPHLFRALCASDVRGVFETVRGERGWELGAALAATDAH